MIGTKWRQVVNFHVPAALALGKKNSIHYIGRRAGLRNDMDKWEKRKIFCPSWDLNPRSSSL
jgi:hypothetical protein